MFKVMGGGEGCQPCSRCWEARVRGVSHVQGDEKGVRAVSHIQGDGRG